MLKGQADPVEGGSVTHSKRVAQKDAFAENPFPIGAAGVKASRVTDWKSCPATHRELVLPPV